MEKPLTVVLPPEMMETRAVELEAELAREGVAVFPSAERATRALAHLKWRYYATAVIARPCASRPKR